MKLTLEPKHFEVVDDEGNFQLVTGRWTLEARQVWVSSHLPFFLRLVVYFSFVHIVFKEKHSPAGKV